MCIKGGGGEEKERRRREEGEGGRTQMCGSTDWSTDVGSIKMLQSACLHSSVGRLHVRSRGLVWFSSALIKHERLFNKQDWSTEKM